MVVLVLLAVLGVMGTAWSSPVNMESKMPWSKEDMSIIASKLGWSEEDLVQAMNSDNATLSSEPTTR